MSPNIIEGDFAKWAEALVREMARDLGVPHRWLTYHRLPKRLRNRERRESLKYLRPRIDIVRAP